MFQNGFPEQEMLAGIIARKIIHHSLPKTDFQCKMMEKKLFWEMVRFY